MKKIVNPVDEERLSIGSAFAQSAMSLLPVLSICEATERLG